MTLSKGESLCSAPVGVPTFAPVLDEGSAPSLAFTVAARAAAYALDDLAKSLHYYMIATRSIRSAIPGVQLRSEPPRVV